MLVTDINRLFEFFGVDPKLPDPNKWDQKEYRRPIKTRHVPAVRYSDTLFDEPVFKEELYRKVRLMDWDTGEEFVCWRKVENK